MMFIRQKLLKQWHTDDVMDTVFFIVCKIYFLFEGNIKCAKKNLEIPLGQTLSHAICDVYSTMLSHSTMITIGHISNIICITELPNKSRVTCTQLNRLYGVIYCPFIPNFFLLGFTGLFIVYSHPLFFC